jgi:SAM-dependent methyltransferase
VIATGDAAGRSGSGLGATELARKWRADLESWAIPPEILASTPESPWVLPRQLFARRSELRLKAPSTPSFERAWEALDPPGTVLDVGTGAGAACLSLAPRAVSVTGVDCDEEMLGIFRTSAEHADLQVRTAFGRWPEIAGEVAPADVVTCHHVLYNVADLEPFVEALSLHARRRVVVEMTAVHPLSFLNPLWERFWGLGRPSAPTAAEALSLLGALGLDPSHETWSLGGELEYESFEDLVEVTRRRLCLPSSRSGEVAAALREMRREREVLGELHSAGTDLFTIWWEGRA